MKTKQNKTLAVVIILAATMAISSCQKEKLTSKVKDSNEQPVKADEVFKDLQKTIMFEVTRNLSFKTESCETIIDDTISVPHVRTIDYGSGCVGEDGKTRKGQMIITYDTEDFMNVSDANSYTTFNNFFLDDNQITGSFNIHNDGLNGSGNYSFTVVAKFDEIIASNGDIESRIGQQTIEWISGAGNSDVTDNEYSYTGSIAGIAANGDSLTLTILQPLIEKRAPGCTFYVSGVELYQSTSALDRYLDYGDGTCDNLAVETVDGVSQTVTLQ